MREREETHRGGERDDYRRERTRREREIGEN